MYKTTKYHKVTALTLSLVMLIGLFSFVSGNEKASASSLTFEPVIRTGSISSSGGVYTTEVTVDYDIATKYHMFSMRTGTSGFTIEVTDIDNNSTFYVTDGGNAAIPMGKLWTPLLNPGNHTGEVTYQISVTPRNYSNNCTFTLIFGLYNDVYPIFQNPSNPNYTYVVPITSRYTYFTPGSNSTVRDNWLCSYTVPVGSEREYYSFTAVGGGNDTISIQSSYNGLMFDIYDPILDSYIYTGISPVVDPLLYSQQYITRLRAANPNLVAGRTYIVELYRDPSIQTAPSYTDSVYTSISGNTRSPQSFNARVKIAIGGPRLSEIQTTSFIWSNTTLTATTSSFAYRDVAVSGYPQSAFATKITMLYSGTGLSNFGRFRYRPPTFSSYVEGADRVDVFNIPFTYEGTNNAPVNGTWSLGYRSGIGTITFTPGLWLYYRYELGN